MKREAERLIEILTGWILKVFSAFAPKRQGCRMETAFRGRGIGPIQPPQLTKFSPTSEIFFSFLPLPTACCLLPTALLGAGAKTQAFVRATPGSARVSPVSVRIAQGFVPILKNGGKAAWRPRPASERDGREKRKSDPQISQITQIFSFRNLKPKA